MEKQDFTVLAGWDEAICILVQNCNYWFSWLNSSYTDCFLQLINGLIVVVWFVEIKKTEQNEKNCHKYSVLKRTHSQCFFFFSNQFLANTKFI